MNKYLKRIITILAVLVLGGLICIPVLGEVSKTSENVTAVVEKNEETVKTSDLFYAYPYHLKAKNQAYATGMEYFSDYQLIFAYEQATNAIYDISSEDEAMKTVITSLKNGVEYTLGELGSALGLTGDFESKAADRATQQLLASTIQNEGILSAIIEESEAMQAAWESVKNADDFVTSGTFALLSDSQKKTIKDALDEKSDILDAVDVVVTAAEVGAYICLMEQVDTVIINYISSCTDNSALSTSLYNYLSYKNSNYQKYIIDKYISEVTIELMNQAVEKGLSYVGTSVGALFTVVDLICEATGSGLSWVTGFGTNEDLLVSMMLDSYVNDFASTRTEMINTFLTEPILPNMIEDYKNAYMFYAISVRALAESVKDVNKAHEELMDYAISNIDKYVSYEAHLDGCKLAVENTPVAERKVVKGNPELYYHLTVDTKISEASDTMEDNAIYFANETIYYGIYACGKVDFDTSGKYIINGNVESRGGSITIPENLELHVAGDWRFVGINTATYYEVYHSEFILFGTVKVIGDFVEGDGGYGRVTMQDASPMLEVLGNVDVYDWDVSSGKLTFRGSSISAGNLKEFGDAKIEVQTDGTGIVNMGFLTLHEGNSPIEIYIMQVGDNTYVLDGSASGHQMETSQNLNETIIIQNQFIVGNLVLKSATVSVEGIMSIENDCHIGQTELNISGILTIGGDCLVKQMSSNLSQTSNILLNGTLKIDGTLAETHYGHGKITMQGEAPLLEVAEDVELTGGDWFNSDWEWDISSGEIKFSGSKVLANIKETGSAKIYFTGTESQNVQFKNYSIMNNLTLDNTSKEGVTFLCPIYVNGLFNHNGCNFTLYNNGVGSTFIDYDGDGWTDEEDSHPMDAALPVGYILTADSVELIIPEEGYTYSGEAFYPDVKVTMLDEELVESVDYTVEHVDNVNAGWGRVIVTAIEPYQGQIEKDYYIDRAVPEITVTEDWNYTTVTDSFVLDAKLIKGDGTLLFESGNEDVATVDEHGVVTVKNVGHAFVWVRVEETRNYYSGAVEVSVTIDRGTTIEGDYDDNKVINSDDAIYLLYHTLMPYQYPVYQNADYDGNGIVNSDDAIQLLYDIMLPEKDDNTDSGSDNPDSGNTDAVEDDDNTGWGPFF